MNIQYILWIHTRSWPGPVPNHFSTFCFWLNRWSPRGCLLDGLLLLYNNYPTTGTCDFTLIFVLPQHDRKSSKNLNMYVFSGRQIGSWVEGEQATHSALQIWGKCLKNITRHEVIRLCAICHCVSAVGWEWEDRGQTRTSASELWIDMERPYGKHLAIW